MTPLKWYEEIYLTAQFSPFRWRLRIEVEPYFGHVALTIGPMTLVVGFPSIKPV